ncbi:bifunctional 3-demethylubiquinone-9 3-methyltransferase/ 2-octaprenyl-6-hydroxy phenol methylase [Poriferisphaera corsica]|uniref:Bifunctional 3-demethylubiquinone-9 3-methyltransferase/ 2-octaprenyl-6-hydroxy phenol methylase n=1 Tax=Poriferisphaera corsica TaxID=2528020 RepID=A0A517YXL8_9BACT|nr:class I SAM-dependent methyltransferase [Poriferisphaera corsica]QDU34968.1 bifunctional 3-demethylubiquinone-9 3-methyltransferase/ 2-octaprenyl-6-hydroxy phenol methylase [Poriferisphaera corsica]
MAKTNEVPAYCAHEGVYRQIEAKESKTWNEHIGQPAIEKAYVRFLDDLCEDGVIHEPKRLLELGCGTGQLLRYLCGRFGSLGHGIDVSKTAIKLAKAQTDVKGITFQTGDVTDLAAKHAGKYDLVVDGLCLHCLTDEEDRDAFIESVHEALTKEGIGIIYTMATPILRKEFQEQFGKLYGKRTYFVTADADKYSDAEVIDGQLQIPTRYFEHYKNIMKSLVDHGLLPMAFRVKLPTESKPLTHLAVAVKKVEL